MKEVQDHYFHKAKKDGYAARSVYKLEEIDQKHQLLRKNQRVLDLGCAPGSWLQYAAQKVGEKGAVIGIDLQAIHLSFPSYVTVIQGDILEYAWSEQWREPFDVILSDMAPKTTGIRSVDAQRSANLAEQALLIAQHCLKPEGSLLVKVFQGGPFEALRREFQQTFQKVKICKPQSSRQESVEIFLLGQIKKMPLAIPEAIEE